MKFPNTIYALDCLSQWNSGIYNMLQAFLNIIALYKIGPYKPPRCILKVIWKDICKNNKGYYLKHKSYEGGGSAKRHLICKAVVMYTVRSGHGSGWIHRWDGAARLNIDLWIYVHRFHICWTWRCRSVCKDQIVS